MNTLSKISNFINKYNNGFVVLLIYALYKYGSYPLIFFPTPEGLDTSVPRYDFLLLHFILVLAGISLGSLFLGFCFRVKQSILFHPLANITIVVAEILAVTRLDMDPKTNGIFMAIVFFPSVCFELIAFNIIYLLRTFDHNKTVESKNIESKNKGFFCVLNKFNNMAVPLVGFILFQVIYFTVVVFLASYLESYDLSFAENPFQHFLVFIANTIAFSFGPAFLGACAKQDNRFWFQLLFWNLVVVIGEISIIEALFHFSSSVQQNLGSSHMTFLMYVLFPSMIVGLIIFNTTYLVRKLQKS